MNSEKWEQAKQLYEAALKIGREERPQFLAENCGGDDELYREVESLLAASDEASGFLETPAIGEVAHHMRAGRSLSGQRVLQYDIIELLGAGGMGEVYLAEDTRLHRKVALKILPHVPGGDRRSARLLEREARAASALNHPNILTVHEFGENDGMNYIASEFVRGVTLRALLNDRALGLPEIASIALQVGSALSAAHASGIIHRDIKPENIMVRDDGLVKVLDFGLAKLTGTKSITAALEKDTSSSHTVPGTIKGTVSYMSPEQARGGETDLRTDIWSMGVVLYEMLTRRTPFRGETATDTIVSILTREPAPLDKELPGISDRIMTKALQKDRDDRYSSVKNLIADLENFKRESDSFPFFVAVDSRAISKASRKSAVASGYSPGKTIRRLWPSNRKLITAAAILTALTGAGIVMWKMAVQSKSSMSLDLESLQPVSVSEWEAEASEGDPGARFSPNGMMIAFSRVKDEKRNIYIKQIRNGREVPITEGAGNYYSPVWSPDGQHIAFVSNRDGQPGIWMTPFSGGELQFLKALDFNAELLDWSKDGKQIFFAGAESGSGINNVFALQIESKLVDRLTEFDDPGNPAQFIRVSPGGDRIAFSAGPNQKLRIFVMPLGDGSAEQITHDDNASDEYPVWTPDGTRIIYSSKREGVFQPRIAYVDKDVTQRINSGLKDSLVSDVSSDGNRVLFLQSTEKSDIWQVNLEGKSEYRITSGPELELWPDVSPDGKQVVFQEIKESKHFTFGSIAVSSTGDPQQIRVIENGFSPSFSPDGRKLAFLRQEDRFDLWVADKNGENRIKLTADNGLSFSGYAEVPLNRLQVVKDYCWSPDSRSLAYSARTQGISNIWQIDADGTKAARQISNNTDQNTRFLSAVFSPDGKQMAYTSSGKSPDGGQIRELYLWHGDQADRILSSVQDILPIGWMGNYVLVAIKEGGPDARTGRVKLALVSGKEGRDLLSVEKAYFTNIRLSADGQKIAIATRENGLDNIRIISSSGLKGRLITANTDPNTYISSIAWSPDSKTVTFGKQTKTLTIWMFENFK